MSKDKPIAVAVLNFYEGNHVDVELSSLHGINPRRLNIAHNLLIKKYLGMRGTFNAKVHAEARKKVEDDRKKAERDEAAFHKAEDIRLAKAAAALEKKVEPKVVDEPEAEIESKENGGDVAK